MLEELKAGWMVQIWFLNLTNSADYHDEMNTEHYMEWFTQQLLPNLPPNSLIFVDNTTYHNKQEDQVPTTANQKDGIKLWLNRQNIRYADTDIKITLLGKVKH